MISICIGCNSEKKIHAHKKCAACSQKDYRKKYPERIRIASFKTYQKHIFRRRSESRNRDPLLILLRAFKNNVKKRGGISNVTVDQLRSFVSFSFKKWHFSNCAYCRHGIIVGVNATIDHVNPEGGNSIENLTFTCKFCNSSKQKLSVNDFMKKLDEDKTLHKEILLKNNKEMKGWLAAEIWEGDFDQLVSKLFS